MIEISTFLTFKKSYNPKYNLFIKKTNITKVGFNSSVYNYMYKIEMHVSIVL